MEAGSESLLSRWAKMVGAQISTEVAGVVKRGQRCGVCGCLGRYHRASECDQCLVDRKPWANPAHEFTEFNKLGNRVL